MRGESYDEFVEKFKPKLTTDDCYTPPKVYDAVKSWVINEYNIQGAEIVRPFYPGGDFENYYYPENCVVIDNPPFSIVSKIRMFYTEKNIKFFIFAPRLTMAASKCDDISYIICDGHITYENGAKVNTGFITNLENTPCVRTAPQLSNMIKKACGTVSKIVKYKYPDNVISPAQMGKFSNCNIKIPLSECFFIRSLESQRKSKKTLFGGGWIVSDKAAAELKAAEQATIWELSDAEQNIIDMLNKRSEKNGLRDFSDANNKHHTAGEQQLQS